LSLGLALGLGLGFWSHGKKTYAHPSILSLSLEQFNQ